MAAPAGPEPESRPPDAGLADRSGKAGHGGRPVNICCVGDDDQSIYGWRGAEVDNILRFDRDFPGATIIRLERNYRSTAHILGAASHLIAHNEGRFGKTLFTDRADPDDARVSVHAAWDSDEEARAVGEEIERLQREKHALNDMAILVRASFQTRAFEDRFIEIGVNYRSSAAPASTSASKSATRWLSSAPSRRAPTTSPSSASSTLPSAASARPRYASSTIRRGAGRADARGGHQACRERRTEAEAAGGAARGHRQFRPLAVAAGDHAAYRARETILEESGYTDMWKNDRSAEAPAASRT